MSVDRTGRTEPLLPRDVDETRTRAGYGKALEVALSQLAEMPDPGDAGPWEPERAPDRLASTPWHAVPARTSTAEALRRGWLVVEAPATGSPDPADGPLAGLRVAVKDLIDVAGMPVHNGTDGGRWREPAESAAAWRLLAEAGAHCVGKSATHEMAFGVTTPQIGNPLDESRVAGGSSGGSAACVAAGVTQGALGTDTGGSVRIPAGLCGVAGFRPTTGSIDMSGITPLAPSQDIVGPIAADLDTCVAMLEVLLGRPLGSPAGQTADGLRVGVLAGLSRIDDATESAYRATLRTLAEHGVELVECESELPQWSNAVSLLTLLLEGAEQHADAVRAAPAGFGGEVRALLTMGEPLQQHRELIRTGRQKVRAHTATLFRTKRLDAFLTPTTACVAPPRDAETVDLDGKPAAVSSALSRFSAWSPVTGMPALSVPVPSPGLPIGMQFMASPGREDICVRVARAAPRS